MAYFRHKLIITAAIAAAGGLVTIYEGRVLHTYPDPVIGWAVTTACDGHTGPELRAGMQFTHEECDEMRAADLKRTYEGLNKCMRVDLTSWELGAYLSLAYNTGPERVCNSSIPTRLKAGDFSGACAAISSFVYVAGLDCRDSKNNCRGIVRRRAAERALCEGKVS